MQEDSPSRWHVVETAVLAHVVAAITFIVLLPPLFRGQLPRLIALNADLEDASQTRPTGSVVALLLLTFLIVICVVKSVPAYKRLWRYISHKRSAE